MPIVGRLSIRVRERQESKCVERRWSLFEDSNSNWNIGRSGQLLEIPGSCSPAAAQPILPNHVLIDHGQIDQINDRCDFEEILTEARDPLLCCGRTCTCAVRNCSNLVGASECRSNVTSQSSERPLQTAFSAANMSLQELSRQLTALSDSLKTTNTLIGRLAKLQFQPGSEPLEGDSGVRVELAQDIRDSLKQLEEDLEYLKQEAEDYRADNDHRRRRSSVGEEEVRLSAKVVRLSEDLAHSRQQFRNAQISAKLASDEAKRREREALLEGYRKEAEQLATAEQSANGSAGHDRDLLFSGRGKRAQQKQLTKDELLVNASSDVTTALRRTHDLLSTELSRSRFAQETFDESTAALAQLGEDYSNLDSILSASRNLLGTLLRSQKSDTWYLETAFYILLTTICWLFFRRILFGPFVRLPLFFWNVFAFFTNWLILRPLFFLLSVLGVITAEPATASSRAASVSLSTSRPPLIVQPSAKHRVSPPLRAMSDSASRGIPVGAGGAGAKVGKDPELEGKMSEQIAKMAEHSGKQDHEPSAQREWQDEEPVRRGDGTILQERGEIPANPKKKNLEADVEGGKQATRQKRDEL